MSEVTQILQRIEQGDLATAERLLTLVYDELKKLAAVRLAQESPGKTLDATALVHEAFVRLVDVPHQQHWNSRGHFFSAAAEAMRRILVENARRKQRQRHGGGRRRVEIADPPAPEADASLLALDEALTRLAEEDPIAARVVMLRRFTNLGHSDVAAAQRTTQESLKISIFSTARPQTIAL
ncbi:MAG: RNA polymerase subunit sigma [Planctomycetaceae bacterium]|nr:MAG: RNA polymerase subunit sigma [Planctomycetaceae bacterium]